MEMDALKALLNNDDRFCRYNGMRIDVLRLGYAEAVMDITENSRTASALRREARSSPSPTSRLPGRPIRTASVPSV